MLTRTIAGTDRAQAARVWQAVQERTGSTWIACSWAWTETWLRHYGDVVPHRFVVGVVDGGDAAIALVTESADRYPRWLGARHAYVGTAGEPRGQGVFVERNRLLVAAGQRDEFAGALLEHLRRDPRWDRLVLPGFHADDAASLQRADAGLVVDERDSPVADLPPGGDPLELLASGPRRRVRRALAGLGPLTTEWAQSTDDGHAVLDELVELHRRRWATARESGTFAHTRFTGFHHELIDRLGAGTGVMLVRVRREGETIGCVYGPIEDGEVLFYQSGLRRSPDNKLNVGLAVHMCAMRACAERGLTAYDFLAPAARYKRDLSTRTASLTWVSLERRRPRTFLHHRLRELQGRLVARRAVGAGRPGASASVRPGC